MQQKFIESLNNFHKFLRKNDNGYILSYILEDMQSLMRRQINTPEGTNLSEQVYSFLRNQNLRSQVLKPDQIAKNFVRDLVLNHQFCTVSLNRLRLSSICHGCSGNATEYLGEADMKISKSKCSLIVKSCSKSWFYIHSQISNVKALWAAT